MIHSHHIRFNIAIANPFQIFEDLCELFFLQPSLNKLVELPEIDFSSPLHQGLDVIPGSFGSLHTRHCCQVVHTGCGRITILRGKETYK